LTGSKISKRYAKALLSLGQEDGNYAEYGENLKEFAGICADNPEFSKVIGNPVFSVEDRKKVLNSILEKSQFADYVNNFLRLLLDQNRISGIGDVSAYYTRLTDEISNIIRAEIVTARPLKDEVVDKLDVVLSKITNKTVKAKVEEDESLIGGLVVKIGDLVLDGSVRAQLEGLKESLKRGEYN
jgi:F-type H+-transporting ATPase subunit delta